MMGLQGNQFEVMEGDCMVLLDADVDATSEAGKQATHTANNNKNSKHGWKLTGALLAVTLCLAATAVFFTGHAKEQDHAEKADDLRHTLRQISGNLRAAIHLEGEHNPDLKTSVEWKEGVDQYHSQGGLKLDHNEIVIPRDGLYFVYSQASFRVSCHSDADATAKPMVHLSHSVQRWSRTYGNDDNKKYETILHSLRTACQRTVSDEPEEEGNWFSAVYMGAVFNLRREDRLKTVMEEGLLDKLEEEPGKTFFGVFAL
ncbi:tumor necrosis factor a (TNF superfamily, member 2) [Centroberyx gerrardi]|uniref:tumor necrosis factor a (TNF superfamily, member 2) n=1 Tax=Centroberyx gerrardi TaxID=166262 RepID=UPI003AAD64BB